MAQTKTIAELLILLKNDISGRELGDFTDDLLTNELQLAIGTINRCRRFTPKETILYDVKYEYLIIPMCVSSLAKIGAEGQTTHSENGVNRQYGSDGTYPSSLVSQIIPLIK